MSEEPKESDKMTLMDTINKEFDEIVEYMLMMEAYNGQPVRFSTVKRGKKYILMLHEVTENKDPAEPEVPAEPEAPKEVA